MVVAGSVTGAWVAGASGVRASVTRASVGVDSVAGGSVAGMDSDDGGTSGVTLRGELKGWADSEVSGSAEACLAISAKSVAGISEVWARVASVFLAESEAGIWMDLIGAASADRKSTRLNSSHITRSRMPSSA